MLYTSLLLVVFILLPPYSSISLRNILTNEESQEWMKNMTERQNSANPYCRLCCLDISSEDVTKNCGHHTMCTFQKNTAGPACKGYIKMKFTTIEKNAIVDAHNTIRNRVASGKEKSGSPGPQPPAANMRALEWDDELATIAERWAEQCTFAKDNCRDSDRYPVGQNIAQESLTKANEISFIRDWYNKVYMYPSKEVKAYKSRIMAALGFSTYTQLVWADTYHIGCARSIFQKMINDHIVYVELFFCNYGPAGNIPDQPVYRIGEPCTYCPEGTQRLITYPNLCGSMNVAPENVMIISNETMTRSSASTFKYLNFLKIFFPYIIYIYL